MYIVKRRGCRIEFYFIRGRRFSYEKEKGIVNDKRKIKVFKVN